MILENKDDINADGFFLNCNYFNALQEILYLVESDVFKITPHPNLRSEHCRSWPPTPALG